MHNKLSLLIIGVMAMCYHCSAAPSELLPRPSPINPDIPMDPKPAERITFITDPKEIAKFKREIKAESTTHDHPPAGPTTTAATTPEPSKTIQSVQHQTVEQNQQHQRHSRDTNGRTSVTPQDTSKQSNLGKLNEKQKPAKEAPARGSTSTAPSTVAPLKHPRNRPTSRSSTQSPAVSSSKPTTATVAAPPTSIKHRQKRDEKPLFNRDQQQQQSKLPTIKEQQHAAPKPLTQPLLTNDGQQKSQQAHIKTKRDIPVPLIPKHKHSEESGKANDKEDSSSSLNTQSSNDKTTEHSIATSSTINNDQQHSTQQHSNDQQQKTTTAPHSSTPTAEPSIFRRHPVPVSELFGKGKSAEVSDHAHHLEAAAN